MKIMYKGISDSGVLQNILAVTEPNEWIASIARTTERPTRWRLLLQTEDRSIVYNCFSLREALDILPDAVEHFLYGQFPVYSFLDPAPGWE